MTGIIFIFLRGGNDNSFGIVKILGRDSAYLPYLACLPGQRVPAGFGGRGGSAGFGGRAEPSNFDLRGEEGEIKTTGNCCSRNSE